MLATVIHAKREKLGSFRGSKQRKRQSCEVNGVTLRHRSMKFYAENSYVACSNGKAGCYLIDRVHEKANQVACPIKNFQQRIDEETAIRSRLTNGEVDVDSGDRRLSLVVVSTTRIWDGGVMCFQLSQEYPFNSNQAELIYEAMSRYETSTNVRFVTTATCEKEGMSFCDSCKTWVDFKHPTSGHDCNSSIGILEDGPQIMNLADRCFEVDDDLKTVYGTAMHEIGHSLGMYHEHQHTMRTIAMFWDDIDQSVWAEMSIREVTVGGPYDPLSIMHYPMSYGFCQPNYCEDETSQTDCVGKSTRFCNLNAEDDNCIDITSSMCNETATKAMGQRKYLSPGDIAALNQLYSSAAWPVSESKLRL
ncbi:hypothetical protein PsorP6_006192 [Peronosclerospora sorghi]|uniref:Uncharacterized protein n=1 Tax=Peronosclerospora sorghi TaxID=230839 RepID=A0ACC0W454_9STRA|nr:hypothetical protein PsorP6_006192 [Peronosclerospora sorghi]